MNSLQNIKPVEVFRHFYNISQIPRGSKNEKAISDYLVKFAEELGLEVIQDDALNVIIKKPASPGYENAPTVIIQGHMDMVCEKNQDTEHDFTKDPINLIVKDDYLYADGTTLGADDGIAVAYAMAVLSDDSLEHPAIEVLITTDEESGMTGAMQVSKDNLQGKILINIDNEDEGYLLVSCAGGIRTKSLIYVDKEPVENNIYHLKVRGLRGGHSGTDIHLGRGNSNKILGRILQDINNAYGIKLIELSGGSKNNAIPREADATFTTSEKDMSNIEEKWNTIIRNELLVSDENVSITIDRIEDASYNKQFTQDSTNKVINLLYLYDNGVNTMSASIENLTESSTNLGVLVTNEDSVELDSAVRSSVLSLRDDIVNRMKVLTESLGGTFIANEGYPGWEYDKESKIRDICKKVYNDMFHKEPVIYAIHAGLECGLFKEILGSDVDMISFGPDIMGAHTPEEHLSISSTERTWNYLVEVLKAIR